MSDRLLYVALIMSLVGLALLVFISESVEPPYTRVAGINSNYLEKRVHLQGVIHLVKEFKCGSIMLSLSQDNHSVEVYLPYSVSSSLNKTSLNGSKADLMGVVQLYNGKIEVAVENPEHLRLK
ncbi:MAG: hypothetical protein NTU61_03330 [Candidatus Altiarchaeota archaeon]|nr:hypothetical protein [Candidatus Altiarchaeota archaeon]